MQKTLVIDPDERYDITQALDHDYPKYWLDVEETNVPSLDLSDYNEEVVVSKQDQSVDHYRDLIRRQLEEYGELHDVFLG
uniref:DUF2247 family protein n=1 Tax=Steinernema glaseri TaxID=37863 RepID=A0A1I8AGW9_9BILA